MLRVATCQLAHLGAGGGAGRAKALCLFEPAASHLQNGDTDVYFEGQLEDCGPPGVAPGVVSLVTLALFSSALLLLCPSDSCGKAVTGVVCHPWESKQLLMGITWGHV